MIFRTVQKGGFQQSVLALPNGFQQVIMHLSVIGHLKAESDMKLFLFIIHNTCIHTSERSVVKVLVKAKSIMLKPQLSYVSGCKFYPSSNTWKHG